MPRWRRPRADVVDHDVAWAATSLPSLCREGTKIYVLNSSGRRLPGQVAHFIRWAITGIRKIGGDVGDALAGILPVTVPGAVWGWQAALKRFGSSRSRRSLEPAGWVCGEGFPVSERIAHDWQLPTHCR